MEPPHFHGAAQAYFCKAQWRVAGHGVWPHNRRPRDKAAARLPSPSNTSNCCPALTCFRWAQMTQMAAASMAGLTQAIVAKYEPMHCRLPQRNISLDLLASALMLFQDPKKPCYRP